MTPPRLLTIAGSDSGGGAGIQADLKTFEAHDVYGMSVVTAVTAQNSESVTAVELVSPDLVQAQIRAVFDDFGVDAVKIGMLGTREIVEAVAGALDGYPPVPLVLDPVMVAKSGDSLLDDAAVEALCDHLIPRTTLLTPNLPEAARLVGRPVQSREERVSAARELAERGASAVLMKGGHGEQVGPGGETVPEDPVVDWLFDGERLHRYAHERIPTRSDHGTGCTLSSAIAAELGAGSELEHAVRLGLQYLERALRKAEPLGRGRGPLNHSGRYRNT